MLASLRSKALPHSSIISTTKLIPRQRKTKKTIYRLLIHLPNLFESKVKQLMICLIACLCCSSWATAQIVVSESETENVQMADSLQTDTLQNTTAHTKNVAEKIFDFIGKIFTNYPKFEDNLADSLNVSAEEFGNMSQHKKKKLLLDFLEEKIHDWNRIDTTYIMPQKYNWAVMLQNTNTFENFNIRSRGESKQTLNLAPRPTFRLGGYFGWRWLFLGYTFDVGGLLGHKNAQRQKTAIDLSFYTSKVGLDLFYRKTGNNYKVTNLNSIVKDGSKVSDQFDGLNLQTRGMNIYYIFNHHYFSYPAAFSQSTVQRKSCGSFKLGFSFTHHKLSLDESRISDQLRPYIDESLLFNSVIYNDYNINFGYSYNWVFAKNFLLCASFSPGFAYNVTHYDAEHTPLPEEEKEETSDLLSWFKFRKLSMDYIIRLGLVYNDTKYFAGLSFIIHTFNYKNEQIRLNNSFGSLNFYIGFNFKKRKK
ncbi:MAG: DUF4421 domain-containing protein [Bacteroidaceae bacterium]|nr:DUF4421 domain-containing protein [Bacteroidaceae bacterium]